MHVWPFLLLDIILKCCGMRLSTGQVIPSAVQCRISYVTELATKVHKDGREDMLARCMPVWWALYSLEILLGESGTGPESCTMHEAHSLCCMTLGRPCSHKWALLWQLETTGCWPCLCWNLLLSLGEKRRLSNGNYGRAVRYVP